MRIGFITYGHFHIVDQSESMLPRKTGVARCRRLADHELLAQIINRHCEQLNGIIDQSGLQLRLYKQVKYLLKLCLTYFYVTIPGWT